MWNNLLSQLQDKIDDAVDLLREDDEIIEEEDAYENDENPYVGGYVDGMEPLGVPLPLPQPQRAAAQETKDLPPLAASQGPSPALAVMGSRATASNAKAETVKPQVTQTPATDGWESESSELYVDEETTTASAPVAPATTEEEKEATVSASAHPEQTHTPTTAALRSPEEIPGAAPEVMATEATAVSSLAAPATSPSASPQVADIISKEADNSDGVSAALLEETSAVPTSPSPAECIQSSDINAPAMEQIPDENVTADASAAAPVAAAANEAVTIPAAVAAQEDPSASPSVPLCGDAEVPPAPSQAPTSAATATKAAAVTHTPTTHSNANGKTVVEGAEAHAQLLRFQAQLADEMANNAALTDENATLKTRVVQLEAELTAAKKSLSTADEAREGVSTLIEKLGREKDRSKHVTEERNALREQVEELGSIVEEYRAKEVTWLSSNTAQAQSHSSAQAHIAELEDNLAKRTERCEELEERLAEVERARTLLSSQLREANRKHEAAVSHMQEATSESSEQAAREVERLRGALRRATAESDERILGLEQELREAVTRAHQAEERLSDLERGAVGSLRDLRTELEDMQTRVSSLTSELGGARAENDELMDRYAALKKARAADEATYKEKLAAQASAVTALTEEKMALSKSLAAVKAQSQAADAELVELRRRCMILENAASANGGVRVAGSGSPFAAAATSPSLPPVASTPSLPKHSEGSPFAPAKDGAVTGSSPAHAAANPGEATGEPLTPASVQSSSSRAQPGSSASMARPPPLFPFSRPSTSGGDAFTPSTRSPGGAGVLFYPFGGAASGSPAATAVGAGDGRTRLEREMVRQAVELERLKQVEAEAVALRAKHKELEGQYDMILQLYGQVEEELRAAKEQKAAGKS